MITVFCVWVAFGLFAAWALGFLQIEIIKPTRILVDGGYYRARNGTVYGPLYPGRIRAMWWRSDGDDFGARDRYWYASDGRHEFRRELDLVEKVDRPKVSETLVLASDDAVSTERSIVLGADGRKKVS